MIEISSRIEAGASLVREASLAPNCARRSGAGVERGMAFVQRLTRLLMKLAAMDVERFRK